MGSPRRGIALVAAGAGALILALAIGVWGFPSQRTPFVPISRDPAVRGRQLLFEGRLKDARQIFQDEYAKNPKNIEALRGLARCAQEEGNDQEAYDHYQQITSLDPKDRLAWKHLALCARRLGRDMEALAAAQTALSLSPDGDPAMSDLMTRLVTGRHPGMDPRSDPMHGLNRPPGPVEPGGGVRIPQPVDPTKQLPKPPRKE